MVSTEENSSSSEFAAAFAALTQSGMSLEALAGVRGVASWAKPSKTDMAYGNGTANQLVDELAEPAVKPFRYDTLEETPTTKPTLALVADNDAAGEDAESVDVKAEATQLLTEILRMDPEVKAGLGAEIALLKAAQQSGRASGIDFERIRDRIAAAETNAQNSKAETPEARAERILDNLREGADNIKDDIYGVMNDEDKARDDAFDEQIAEARRRGDFALVAKLEREQNDWRAQRVEEWRVSGTPQQQAVIPRVVPAIKDQDERIEAAVRALDEQNHLITNESFRGSAPTSVTMDSNPAQIQAQSSAPALTAIAYNAGAQELTRPLETPAEAAAAASRGTTRNI